MLKDRIRAARNYAQLTQLELVVAVGMHQTGISGLERGHSASTTHIAQIAEACGVSETWLKRGEGQMLPPNQLYSAAELDERVHGEVETD